MKLLTVNVDHVATLRQARGTRYPEVISAAMIAENSGADGITAHLREDRRHIQDRDIRLLRETITTRLNMEMACTDEMVAIACEIKPELVTLVPEKRQEITTEGGLDVKGLFESLKPGIEKLKSNEIPISLFIDPVIEQIEYSQMLGVKCVELHTGHFCNFPEGEERDNELMRIKKASKLAKQMGLIVNVGHGLSHHNVHPFARIPEIHEFAIGHAIISMAVFVGLEKSVRWMKALINGYYDNPEVVQGEF